MRVSKLRKKLLNKGWLRTKYEQLLDQSEEWNHFEDFKCRPFFVGYERAEYNKGIHAKAMKRIRRQLKFIGNLLNKSK